MDIQKAWEIAGEWYRIKDFSEDEMILYEEALNYILVEALESSETYNPSMWQNDIIAGAYNLASYYEKIGKYKLALKYYSISEKYGGDLAGEKINRIKMAGYLL